MKDFLKREKTISFNYFFFNALQFAFSSLCDDLLHVSFCILDEHILAAFEKRLQKVVAQQKNCSIKFLFVF